MINVSLKTDASKRYLRLKVRGHAEMDVKGKDIVCASATILAYTVAQAVRDMGNTKKLAIEPVIILKDGLATVTCVCNSDEAYWEAFMLYDFANIGYTLLAHSYPQYVKVNTVGIAN